MQGRCGWTAIVAGAWLVLLPAAGNPGEYHWGPTLHCADCHVTGPEGSGMTGGTPTVTAPATSRATTVTAPSGGRPPIFSAPTLRSPSTTAAPTLPLRKPGDALCLDCHDGRVDAPDVLGDNTGTHVRQGGALPTGAPPYKRTNGHELGVTATPPGGAATVTLHCTTCHNPHGTAYFRNLPRVTYAKGRNDPSMDVFLRSWVPGQIAVNYGADNVDFNEPNPRGSAMAEFCQECHRAFHTTTAPGGAWLRHPTAVADISQRPGDHTSLALFASRRYRVKVMSQTGDWGQQGSAWRAAPSGLTPTCITCHRAHGNRNPFGLVAPTGTTAITEEGDGKVPLALCRQCHAQAIEEAGAPRRLPQAP